MEQSTLSPPLSPNLSPSTSPYITAPSTPKHASDDDAASDFEIELKPFDYSEDESNYQDITFEFSVDHFQSFSLPAEELFDGGKIRTLKPPPSAQPERASSPPASNQNASQGKRKIIWSSRRSYDDFSETYRAERGKTLSFGGSTKTARLNKLISILTFRRPLSASERGSTSSKASTSFGSESSSSGSLSGWGGRYLSGSVREADDVYGGGAREEVKSCLTPCKQRLLSCFVKKF